MRPPHPGLDKSTPKRRVRRPTGFARLRGQPELLDMYASAKHPATATRLSALTEQVLGEPLPT